jgi:hypothetical protein
MHCPNWAGAPHIPGPYGGGNEMLSLTGTRKKKPRATNRTPRAHFVLSLMSGRDSFVGFTSSCQIDPVTLCDWLGPTVHACCRISAQPCRVGIPPPHPVLISRNMMSAPWARPTRTRDSMASSPADPLGRKGTSLLKTDAIRIASTRRRFGDSVLQWEAGARPTTEKRVV